MRKASLSALLDAAGALDAEEQGFACAYMAVQLPQGGMPAVYRSSPLGFVQSLGFDPGGERHFVSMGHLGICLRASADNLELSVQGGAVCVESVDGPYRNFMRVHTVLEQSSGTKYHSIGEPAAQRLDPGCLAGLSVSLPRELPVSQQPSFHGGRLCVATQAGLARWRCPPGLAEVGLGPCRSFLRFACGARADAMAVSAGGYWVCQRGGVAACVASHRLQDSVRQAYEPSSVTPLATVDAARLVDALSRALQVCGRAGRVHLGGERGVRCRDAHGNEAEFGLGQQPPWGEVGVLGSTAQLLVFFLRQSGEKEAAVQSLDAAAGPALRVSRGDFDVDFRAVS